MMSPVLLSPRNGNRSPSSSTPIMTKEGNMKSSSNTPSYHHHHQDGETPSSHRSTGGESSKGGDIMYRIRSLNMLQDYSPTVWNGLECDVYSESVPKKLLLEGNCRVEKVSSTVMKDRMRVTAEVENSMGIRGDPQNIPNKVEICHSPSSPQPISRSSSMSSSSYSTPPPKIRGILTSSASTSSLMRMSGINNLANKSPCNRGSSSNDRFIPNRSQMRVDLCQASIIMAEQKRVASVNKRLEELRRLRGGENGDPNSPSTPPSSSSSSRGAVGETLTPLQAEFRRRMRGALLSIPLEDMTRGLRGGADSVMSRSGSGVLPASASRSGSTSMTQVPATFGQVDLSNLAYMGVDDNDPIDSPHVSSMNGTGARRGIPGRDTARMLQFGANNNSSTVSRKNRTSFVHHGNMVGDENSLASSSTLARTKRSQQRTPPSPTDPYTYDQLRVLQRTSSSPFSSTSSSDTLIRSASFRSSANRRISSTPSRILDAPELVDDYYLNLVSWGQHNMLAVALGQCVYLWNADTGDIKHLLTLRGQDDYVTSVSWAMCEGNTNLIAVGTNDSPVQLWDAEALKKVRTLGGHSARVGSLAWNQHWLSSGGRDSLIIQHDVRAANHIASTYVGHTQEVCGLKWNDDGTSLASGGNENYLCLWDSAMSTRNTSHHHRRRPYSNTINPRLLLTQHQAAVKALAWCPFHRGLLASGGGTADRTIKFWNTNSGSMLNSIDTGSQVCSLLWSKHQRELCSSHGFSENQLILWRYPTLTKIQEFKGHTARVLHMEQSPDGACVVSAAADETLRFWDVFGSPPNKAKRDTFSIGSIMGNSSTIR